MAARYYARRSFAKHFDDLMDDTYFEINIRMINRLPKFRGSHVDHPLTHLRDLHTVCNALRPRGVNEVDFMLRMFLYSLTEYAKSWLFSLSVVSMPQWEQMRQLFLKEHSIKQHPQETTYEYLERFRNMWDTCPDYSLHDHVVALSFLDGMNSHEREIMDEMAGGEIMEFYPEDVWDLICQRAADTQPYFQPHHRQLNQPTHYDNAPERSLNDAMEQLAQTVRQIQEQSDKVYAEISKQIAQNSEVIFGRQGITEKPRSDVDADALWNARVLDAEQTKTTRYFEEEQINFITGEEHVISADEEEEGTPNPSLSAPVTSSLPTPIVNPGLTELFLAHRNSLISCSKVPHVITSNINVSNIPLPFYVHRSTPTKLTMNKAILDEEVSSYNLQMRTRHSNYVWKPGWNFSSTNCDKSAWKGHKIKVIVDNDKMFELIERVDVGMSSDRACKNISRSKKRVIWEHTNWKRWKKKRCTILGNRVSVFFKPKRRRHSMFEWKPGWNFWRGTCGTPNKRVRTVCNKFDGVHPWAPNL